ncbi:MAG: hypothetical protein A3J59_02380 [Candidatus Buchananbacteria bacterium RIFCSPHIGHO2_02_FULL_56_16]|uniref:VTC domain-containing protein n=1 Tax=Candidatus Buchananbacteria bacterium RIFCSPHIGHO2_02_FULL_56_16 TaxID=1797542 RepID=A0A1G1YGC6_9BACT|nr:MAG: hypothetical protein A3J59_02380 [Candidatus Buchananbacteria bacterium RIFCSPHIGHO2_02_FULL_56_16]
MELSTKTKIKVHFQRFEFKYQLPVETIEGLLPQLLKYLEFDPYAQRLPGRQYTVASLYYDSAGLDCYYQKLAGLRTRKKLRVRLYDFNLKPETPVFLEIKRKYDTVVVKDRLTMSYQACQDLLVNNKKPATPLSDHDQETLNEFLWLKLYNGMVPQVMVLYDRKPLVGRVDPQFRVTIDSNVRTFTADWLTAKGIAQPVSRGIAVLEVKFNNVLPFWFHQIIRRYNLAQQPFSKYCRSLETCQPALSAESSLEIYQAQLGLSS